MLLLVPQIAAGRLTQTGKAVTVSLTVSLVNDGDELLGISSHAPHCDGFRITDCQEKRFVDNGWSIDLCVTRVSEVFENTCSTQSDEKVLVSLVVWKRKQQQPS
jgi:hypothetical protein